MSLEHAPPNRRAFYASFPQAGVPAGTFLSSGAFFLVTLMPEEQLLAWGWRIPFLCSALLIAVGLYIRLRVTESPEFLAMQDRGEVAELPAAEIFRSHKRALVVGMLCMLAANAVFYLASTFFLSYGPVHLGLSRGLVLTALLVAAAIQVVTLPLFAIVADRTGAKRFLIAGCLLVAAGAFPLFLLFDTGTVAGVVAAYLLALPVLHAVVYGSISSFTAELFPPAARYTGSSVAYHLGGAVTAAPVPIVATLLLAEFGSSSAIAIYVILAALVCGVVIALAPAAWTPAAPVPARPRDAREPKPDPDLDLNLTH
jgi:MFS family permease